MQKNSFRLIGSNLIMSTDNAGQTEETIFEKIQNLQSILISRSTSSFSNGDLDNISSEYIKLRKELIGIADIREKLPRFVIKYQDLGQFWQFIKMKYLTYAERRTFIWDSFSDLLIYLEINESAPSDNTISDNLTNLNAANVNQIWQKALERRDKDPEGAITSARTLLESVCKNILDNMDNDYPEDLDLPKLWTKCAEKLNLSPSQHTEEVFKSILGNCQSIVNNLASIRNKIGDAHGKGKKAIKPQSRHAMLVVNLAGSMSSFLVETWENHCKNIK